MDSIPYHYRNAPVPGGGFVTGFVFHPKFPGICYARTDIGGIYRYRPETRSWKSLCDGVTHPERWETYPLSIAISPFDADTVYAAAGDGRARNYLCVSRDRGETFLHRPIPTGIHGNASGRGTGERLLASSQDPDTLYFASQTGGLLATRDLGHSWERLSVWADGGREEANLTFLFIHPENERVLLVGTNGEGNSHGSNVRGPSLYLSKDGGESFRPMPGQPAPILHPACTHPGYVAQRCAFDGKYLYVTFCAPGYCWAGYQSYACDTGSCFDGLLMRYVLSKEGEILEALDLTPPGYADPSCPQRLLGAGLSGICADLRHPGVVILSTVCHPDSDTIYYSKDHGLHFTPILHGLDTGILDFTVDYMKPEYNGGHSIVHWMGDLKINPFDPGHAFFNTGTGIFATFNLTDALQSKPVRWQPLCGGLEETVHLNVYSPAQGPVKLIDIIGDLGGFAFSDLDRPCENSFADGGGNRYITCMNADYPEACAAPVVVTARGNWKGKTTGGLILSDDFCKSWARLPDPAGISPFAEKLMADIRRPNVNAGWTAISADGGTIVWGLARGNDLPIPGLLYTRDRGQTWHQSQVYDLEGALVTSGASLIKVFSDRVWPEVFYGFGEDSRMYVSLDKSTTFRELLIPAGLPRKDLSGIDSRQDYEIRAQRDCPGVLWMALAEGGLWRLCYDRTEGKMLGERISNAGDTVYRIGMGKPNGSSVHQTLYLNGILCGAYGFYRSIDGGRSFERINGEKQMYGDIRSIAGDPRVFGRFYIATGTRGVLYGEPAQR